MTDAEQGPHTIDAATEPWPKRPRRLATAVVEDLVDQIVGGTYRTGASLPIEPQLCTTYGVSRTVVREAVKTLESTGLVTVQQGQGTRVRPLEEWDLLHPTVIAAAVRHDENHAILEDIIDVRCALESQMAARAASLATAADRHVISQRLEALEGLIHDPYLYAEADIAFHDAILAVSGNRLGRAMIRNLNVEANRSLRYFGTPTEEHIRLGQIAHERIHDAVLAGDAPGAAQAMDDHIRESWERRRPRANRTP